ncbi:MAG: hypothetical protein R3B54_11980 [Bdellovibrionota bacterium]
MNRIKTMLPALLSSLVFLLFTACGGEIVRTRSQFSRTPPVLNSKDRC